MPNFETSLAPVYEGQLDAKVFETAPEREKNIIRTDQDWGVKVAWEMNGFLAIFVDEEFQMRVFLESMGPGTEYALPAAPEKVGTLTGTLDPVLNKRTYNHTLTIDHTTTPINPGTYRLTVTLQVFDKASGSPWPVAGFIEGPMVQFYKPT